MIPFYEIPRSLTSNKPERKPMDINMLKERLNERSKWFYIVSWAIAGFIFMSAVVPPVFNHFFGNEVKAAEPKMMTDFIVLTFVGEKGQVNIKTVDGSVIKVDPILKAYQNWYAFSVGVIVLGG